MRLSVRVQFQEVLAYYRGRVSLAKLSIFFVGFRESLDELRKLNSDLINLFARTVTICDWGAFGYGFAGASQPDRLESIHQTVDSGVLVGASAMAGFHEAIICL